MKPAPSELDDLTEALVMASDVFSSFGFRIAASVPLKEGVLLFQRYGRGYHLVYRDGSSSRAIENTKLEIRIEAALKLEELLAECRRRNEEFGPRVTEATSAAYDFVRKHGPEKF